MLFFARPSVHCFPYTGVGRLTTGYKKDGNQAPCCPCPYRRCRDQHLQDGNGMKIFSPPTVKGQIARPWCRNRPPSFVYQPRWKHVRRCCPDTSPPPPIERYGRNTMGSSKQHKKVWLTARLHSIKFRATVLCCEACRGWGLLRHESGSTSSQDRIQGKGYWCRAYIGTYQIPHTTSVGGATKRLWTTDSTYRLISTLTEAEYSPWSPVPTIPRAF